MNAAPSSGFQSPEARMPSFWLPPDVHGNGLAAERWSEIVAVPPERADELLRAFHDAGIPARAGAGRRATNSSKHDVQVWVDPDRYAQAENVLLREMSHEVAALSSDDAPVSRLEAKQLWWFCDGAIMDDDTRTHLWQARGLCTRHSWMYFCAECELKYQPLGVAVLHEDLIARSQQVLARHRPDGSRKHALTPRASCFTCDYLSTAHGMTPAFAAEQDQMQAAVRTRDWARTSRPVWRVRTCPRCRPGDSAVDGILCRQHLIEHGTHDDIRAATCYLDELQPRVRRCRLSMTYDGPDRTVDSDAALVEAIGWLAGWRGGTRYTVPT